MTGLDHYSKSLRTKALKQEFKALCSSGESWTMCECKTILCPSHVGKGVLKSHRKKLPAPCGWCDGNCAECGGCPHEAGFTEDCEVCGGGSEGVPCYFNDCPGCYFDIDSEEELEDFNEVAIGATVIIHPTSSYIPAFVDRGVQLAPARQHSTNASLGKVVGYDFESSKWAVNNIDIFGEPTGGLWYQRTDSLTLIGSIDEVMDAPAIRDAMTLLLEAPESDSELEEQRFQHLFAEYDRVLLHLIEHARVNADIIQKLRDSKWPIPHHLSVLGLNLKPVAMPLNLPESHREAWFGFCDAHLQMHVLRRESSNVLVALAVFKS